MDKTTLRQFAPIMLAIGLAGLVLAGVAYIIVRRDDPFIWVTLAVGVAGLGLAVAMAWDDVRTFAQGRQARAGSNVAVMVVAALGIVILVNFLAARNPVRWDYSENQINTLAPESAEALRRVPQPVQAIGFYSSNFTAQRLALEALLHNYQSAAPDKLTLQFIDPEADPLAANRYAIAGDATLILLMGNQREEMQFATEQDITSALVRFNQPERRALYFLTGHGELRFDTPDQNGRSLTVLAELLRRQNYDLRPLNLRVTTTVPSDARAVIIAGPTTALSPEEVTVLGNYLRYNPNAGLVALLDPRAENQAASSLTGPVSTDPLAVYLHEAWGLRLRDDVVLDPVSALSGQALTPQSARYADQPIVTKLQSLATIFPVAQSIEVTASTLFTEVTNTGLIFTSNQAWGETTLDVTSTDDLRPDGNDATGELTLAAAASHNRFKSRVVVVGDATFVSDRAVGGGLANTANAALVVNSINWATQDETLLNLTPKVPTSRFLVLSDSLTINTILFVTVIAMPVSVLVLGGVVWFLRRRVN